MNVKVYKIVLEESAISVYPKKLHNYRRYSNNWCN